TDEIYTLSLHDALPISELGEIFPGQFMGLAEEIGLISQLSDWAIGKICRQHKQWAQQGAPDIKVAVNVSASDLLVSDFVSRIKRSEEHTSELQSRENLV